MILSEKQFFNVRGFLMGPKWSKVLRFIIIFSLFKRRGKIRLIVVVVNRVEDNNSRKDRCK